LQGGNEGDDAMRFIPPIAVALLAAACAPVAGTQAPAPTDDAPYRAIGTEPGWALTIGDEMHYAGDYGETKIIIPTPEPRASVNGDRYVTTRLIVDITHAPCSDGMSDRRYPDTVTVTADGKTVHGCGGAGGGKMAVALAGSDWSIATINGAPATTARATSMHFGKDGRISGNAGCNSFGGSYTLEDDTLTVGQVVSTKMACLGPGMKQESAVFAILAQPMRVSRQDNNTVALSSDAGTIVLKPAS
jgi:heat shock protein HslJ